MNIEREINGVKMTFALTEVELYSAYIEQQHIFDCMDIRDLLSGRYNCFDDKNLIEYDGKTKEDVFALVDDMAYEMRRNIDKYNMSFEYAGVDAIQTVLYNQQNN